MEDFALIPILGTSHLNLELMPSSTSPLPGTEWEYKHQGKRGRERDMYIANIEDMTHMTTVVRSSPILGTLNLNQELN